MFCCIADPPAPVQVQSSHGGASEGNRGAESRLSVTICATRINKRESGAAPADLGAVRVENADGFLAAGRLLAFRFGREAAAHARAGLVLETAPGGSTRTGCFDAGICRRSAGGFS